MFQQEGGFGLNKVKRSDIEVIYGNYDEIKERNDPEFNKQIFNLFLAKNIENTKFNELTINKLIEKNIEIADLKKDLYLKPHIDEYGKIIFYLLNKAELNMLNNNIEIDNSKKVFTISSEFLRLINLPFEAAKTRPFEEIKVTDKLGFTDTAKTYTAVLQKMTENKGGRKRRRTNKRRMNKSKKTKCTKARRNNKTKGKARNVKRIKRTQRHRRNRH